jgi:AraC-like DNA-binding protein
MSKRRQTPEGKLDEPSQLMRDFPTFLRVLVEAYLDDGYPQIELAAEITGTSVRTLQRRLSDAGLSYSELVQQVRFDAAVRMLSDRDTSLTNVAYRLGYTDPSNFSRAFRHMTGVSPREFRQQLTGFKLATL